MKARVWDRFHQMPSGREFEIYHYAEDVLQPVWYHAHPYYEIYFFVQGHNRIIVEGTDIQPQRGDVLIYPPGCTAASIWTRKSPMNGFIIT